MRLYVILLLLCGAAAAVHAICKLTRNAVERETRIYAWGRTSPFRLLRKDSVRAGTQLQLLCPGSRKLAVRVTCTAKGRFSRRLPVRNCAQVNANVIAVVDRTCAHQAYSVGYKVNRQFLELYRSCYDLTRMRTVHTTHTAMPFSLTTDRPDVDFSTDGIITPADAATFKRNNVFLRFRTLLGARQTYIRDNTTTVISRGHLTPSADYLFVGNMRATFKYINAVPQFQSINVGNWQRVENWVRRLVATVSKVSVITGARDVLQLRDTNNNMVSMYLANNNRNPIPKWIYKIVKSNRGNYVFLTYNNIYNAAERFGGTCNQVGCPQGLTFNANRAYGHTVCCNPATFRA